MKLRELLGSPGVHVFMLVHTLAGGYTPSSASATRRGWRERVYACRCTGILGVLTLRLAVEELRNARAKRKKEISIFCNDDNTVTRGVVATPPVDLCRFERTWRAARGERVFREIRVATGIIGFPSVSLALRKTAIEKRKRILVYGNLSYGACVTSKIIMRNIAAALNL